MKKIFQLFYIFCVIIFLAVLGCFTFFQDNVNSKEVVKKPMVMIDHQLNENLLNDIENYAAKSFGFRNEIVGLFTSLKEKYFNVSAIDNVIVGNDGYLFYGETIDDYIGNKQLTEREMFQITHTLELMQEYVELQGSEFLFIVAPNKNSLYGQFMPYQYIEDEEESLTKQVFSRLDQVNYVDLFDLFQNESEILYYQTDSHWNNQGARLVYDHILNILNKEHDDFTNYPTQIKQVKGDLYDMLYPRREKNENSFVYQKEKQWQYLTKTRETSEQYIETYNDKATGSLLMFRDSFANNLVEYFSDAYQYVIYDKNSQYDLFEMKKYHADTVILEIVERQLISLQEKRPKFYAPKRIFSEENVISDDVLKDVEAIREDDHILLEGIMNSKKIEEKSLIYVKNKNEYFELTPQLIDGQYGFFGCLPFESLDEEASILLINSKNTYMENILEKK